MLVCSPVGTSFGTSNLSSHSCPGEQHRCDDSQGSVLLYGHMYFASGFSLFVYGRHWYTVTFILAGGTFTALAERFIQCTHGIPLQFAFVKLYLSMYAMCLAMSGGCCGSVSTASMSVSMYSNGSLSSLIE